MTWLCNIMITIRTSLQESNDKIKLSEPKYILSLSPAPTLFVVTSCRWVSDSSILCRYRVYDHHIYPLTLSFLVFIEEGKKEVYRQTGRGGTMLNRIYLTSNLNWSQSSVYFFKLLELKTSDNEKCDLF